jgi:GTP-binding protein EngB required for normal cell division
MTQREEARSDQEVAANVLAKIERVCCRHGITSLDEFISSCRLFAEERTLNIAIFGRFKAGKSSFLNHLLGRPLLPVGVIPVTSIVTEIQWGPGERAEIEYLDGHKEEVSIGRVAEFISEAGNPANAKGVGRVRVALPSMTRFRGVRFVDTPGLESVFEHNTGASLEWLPNVGLALVAVGVDPPLSQSDIELIRKLSRYTPNISILLTKVDVLEPGDREQVLEFVRRQISRFWKDAVPVFPYSIKPGFETLRTALDQSLLAQAQNGAGEKWAEILAHKLDTLITECESYLRVALRAAEVADSERAELRRKILGHADSLEDARLALRLIVRHAAAHTRSSLEALLRPDEAPLQKRLHETLRQEMQAWMTSLSAATDNFDQWMRSTLASEMNELSRRRRAEFTEPIRRVGRQLAQSLQDFRNRLSENVLETLGVPLRTTEMEMRAEEPKSPNIRVGKIYDRNWELLSWLIPMPLVRGLLERHFHGKLDRIVNVNLSRLVSQWEDALNRAFSSMEKDAQRRLDDLVATVERLTAAAGQQAPRNRAVLEEMEALRQQVRSEKDESPK